MNRIKITKVGAHGVCLGAAVLVSHAPLILLRSYSAFPQPLFELDLLVALFIFALHRPFGILAILLAWLLSALRGVALNYHFHNVAEFVDSMRFAELLSYSTYVTLTGVLIWLAGFLAILILMRVLVLIRPKVTAVAGLIIFLMCADILNGSATVFGLGRDRSLVQTNILGTSAYNLLRAEFEFVHDGAQPLRPLENAPPSYMALLRHSQSTGADSMALIVVESLGLPNGQELRDWLFSQMINPALNDRWRVEIGEETFKGGTVAAELRVMCGLQGHYSTLTVAASEPCIARQMSLRGFRTTAMHGFSRRMFDRGEWWPVAGFKETFFDDHWDKQHLHRCDGAFDAACDHDVIASALTAASGEKQFVYALTINSHLPLLDEPLSSTMRALCDRNGVREAACQLLHSQGKFLRDLSSQLAATSGALRQVIVVGDHSPPFHGPEDREVFSPERVPLFVIERR